MSGSIRPHDVVAGDERRVRARNTDVARTSVPMAIPEHPTALFAFMKLFWTVVVTVTGPSACNSIAMQSMFRMRLAAVPLLETL